MENGFGVAGGLEDRAFPDQLAAQREAVGDVAIMGNGKSAAIEFGEQWLDVAQDGFAGCGIAGVANGGIAFEAVNDGVVGEIIADKAHASLRMEAGAVEGDDAGGFLTAVLQGVQAKRSDGGGLRMAEDAENAAFFPETIRERVKHHGRIAFQPLIQIYWAGAAFGTAFSGVGGAAPGASGAAGFKRSRKAGSVGRKARS